MNNVDANVWHCVVRVFKKAELYHTNDVTNNLAI